MFGKFRISMNARRERTASARGTLLKIAIMLIALQDNGQGAATPALATIGEAFPLAGYQLISLVATIPAIMEAIIPIIYPAIVEKVRKRSVLFVCIILYLIGGVGPAVFNQSIALILFFRFLLGIGTGIFSVMCPDLVIDFFDGREKNTMMGWSAAFTGLSGVVFQTVGGWLAGIHWSYCFYAYLFSVACLIVSFILLPEPKRKEKIVEEITAHEGEELQKKIPKSVWVLSIFMFFYWMMFYTIITNGSGIIIGDGIGTVGQIGLIFSTMTGGQVISAALFGWIVRKIGYRFAIPLGLLFGAAGLFVASGAQTLGMFVLSFVCLGVATGIFTPGLLDKSTSLVPYAIGNKALCVQLFMMGVGGFISPFVLGNLGLTPRGQVLLGAIVYLVMIPGVIIANHFIKTKNDVPEKLQ